MKQLLTIAAYITAVATIAGAALWFDSRFDGMEDNNAVVLDSVSVVKQMVEYINVEQSIMAEEIAGIHDTLRGMQEDEESQAQHLNSLTWMFRNKDTFTPEQMKLLLDSYLKKNNDLTVSTETLSETPE